MKTSISILAIASMLSIADGAPSPAAAAAAVPTVYIKVYQVPGCVEPEGVEAGQFDLPEGSCTNISPQFLSFQGGTQDPKCPAGTTATVSAFQGTDCTKQSLGVSDLPANEAPSTCLSSVFVPSVGSGEGGRVDALSARFSCVTT